MRAFVLTEFGTTPEVVDVEIPEPAEGEVRVRVHAASVNGFDMAVATSYLEGDDGAPVPGRPGQGLRRHRRCPRRGRHRLRGRRPGLRRGDQAAPGRRLLRRVRHRRRPRSGWPSCPRGSTSSPAPPSGWPAPPRSPRSTPPSCSRADGAGRRRHRRRGQPGRPARREGRARTSSPPPPREEEQALVTRPRCGRDRRLRAATWSRRCARRTPTAWTRSSTSPATRPRCCRAAQGRAVGLHAASCPRTRSRRGRDRDPDLRQPRARRPGPRRRPPRPTA